MKVYSVIGIYSDGIGQVGVFTTIEKAEKEASREDFYTLMFEIELDAPLISDAMSLFIPKTLPDVKKGNDAARTNPLTPSK